MPVPMKIQHHPPGHALPLQVYSPKIHYNQARPLIILDVQLRMRLTAKIINSRRRYRSRMEKEIFLSVIGDNADHPI